jgi:hypothetical protein
MMDGLANRVNWRRAVIGAAVLVFSCAACSCGRVPSAKKAQSVATGHLKGYGRKYRTSDFGGRNLDRIAINSVQEVSRHVAEVDAIAALKDGRSLRVLVTLQKKFPQGWFVVSWERVGM